ncbi:MAG TPA: proline dehydrogenase family protein, partial [Gaiellaceae bacterium]
RLKRTVEDVRALAELKPSVRLCKGIYLERPEIAYRDYEAVRSNFVQALEELWEAGCYVGVATHDDQLLDQAEAEAERRGLGREDFEFQMLLGVRPTLGDALVLKGHRLRIYTPFGRDWYEYSLRRLQENPRIAGYIATDTLGRLIPGRNGAA